MSESPSDVYTLLESSFSASPNLRSHKPLPRRSDSYRRYEPAASKEAPLWRDDETDSLASSELPTPTPTPSENPPLMNGADSGLPPTPPSNSQDGLPATEYSPPPHADSVVTSLTSRKSTLSTPVNQRSPPTPDPSPQRKNTASMTTPERPLPFTYASSRAESFTTAREDPSSSGMSSRTSTPTGVPLRTVNQNRGLGLAFEHEDNDITPRNTIIEASSEQEVEIPEGGLNSRDDPNMGDIPNREWDTNVMRNVTVRRKRDTKPPLKTESPSPRIASPVVSAAAASTPRRTSSLRERVEASKFSPHSQSIENFAKSIGWPADAPNAHAAEGGEKRFSGVSMSSTVVEATVVVTPPQRRRTLRHSGKNLAYRRDPESPIGSELSASPRTPMRYEDVPLHRLVHKRGSASDRMKRMSSDSASMCDRTASPASLRQRAEESAAVTLAHQRSIRSVLQPAADIMSRSNSVTRSQPVKNFHKRIASAPEPPTRVRTPSVSHSAFEVSPPDSPSPKREQKARSRLAHGEAVRSSSPVENVHDLLLPRLVSRKKVTLAEPPNINKSLPRTPSDDPVRSSNDPPPEHDHEVHDGAQHEARPSSAMLDRVRHLLAVPDSPHSASLDSPRVDEHLQARAPSNASPTAQRGSLSSRGRSEEKRRSSISQDRTSLSRDALLRPNSDGTHTEELPRSSHEWRSFHTDDNGRVSFDRSSTRTDEHAMARHLFSQTTPFSQVSDTPFEVSEATAVSIYPHNNNSLLVVQQVARASLQPQETRMITSDVHPATPDVEELEEPATPPFVDAVEGPSEPSKPTFTFEPSTPPMQIDLPTFEGAVDSPLKNPRKPPEPPVIKFIPPTPAEELERQLVATVPGPPKRSDSHPQRRLSLKQRARRYSDNFISPFLARATSIRGRSASVSHQGHSHGQLQIPSVNDEDGSLHPFWRPRGFWDGFEDSDSDSEGGVLPAGGDTSDVEDDDSEPPSPRKLGVLGRRLTTGLKNHNNFLIGNSLGVERSGTNRRKPHIHLPPRGVSTKVTKRSAPKVPVQVPTLSFRRTHSARLQNRPSRASLSSSSTLERPRRRFARESWRQGRKIPGLKGVQVQYIGLSGVKERFREKRAERRREALRKSIGGRWYVEPGTPGGAVA